MKRRTKGLSLAEVMVALLVLALGAVPLFALNSGAHEDTTDAVAFLGMLDRLDFQLAAGAKPAVVRDGARELAQADRPADPYLSFAPEVRP